MKSGRGANLHPAVRSILSDRTSRFQEQARGPIAGWRIQMRTLTATFLASLLALAGCSEKSTLPIKAGMGPDPQLPALICDAQPRSAD